MSGPRGLPTNYLYDGERLIEETDSNGAAVTRYSQDKGIDAPLAMFRGGTKSYYQADGLGSVTSLTNSSGAVAQAYGYDSFGKQTASSGSLTNPFQYTGREFDPETNLYYYRARYLDPSVGRFLSEDPLSFQSGPNYYSYVRNSPMGFIDPAGLAQINYNVIYTHYNFWYSLWNAGHLQPHYTWQGTCTKMYDEKWKLNLTLTVTFDFAYSSDRNRRHEKGHLDIAEAFFNKNKSHYEAFEGIFRSESECEKHLRNRLNGAVLNQLQSDEQLLDQEENNYDGWWGWWND